jgi:hypothetical protein
MPDRATTVRHYMDISCFPLCHGFLDQGHVHLPIPSPWLYRIGLPTDFNPVAGV